MSLKDFFSINFPYGIEKRNNSWAAFNRSYMPLGWHTKKDEGFSSDYTDLVSMVYKGLTGTILTKLAISEAGIAYDEQGNIFKVMLYDESTDPRKSKKLWENYTERLYILSKLEIDRKTAR